MRSNILIIILFLLLALAILGGAHLVVYGSAVHFFDIAGRKARLWLGISLSLLALSFLAASLLVRWQDVALTRGLYFLAGLWLGILTYLVICFAGAWIIGSFWTTTPRFVLGSSAIALALVISAYGVWSQYHPRIKNIDVTLKNLPAAWQGKTIVQISDVHLGNILGRGFLAQVVAQTNALNPEMVVVTGDLLDGMGDDLKHSVQPLNDLKAPRGAYFITGNHETFLPPAQVSEALAQTKLNIMKDEEVDLDGLRLVGVDFVSMGQSVDLAQTVKRLVTDHSSPTILLYHSPVQVDAVSQTGLVDLMLSGHTHQGQLWPFNLITWLVYKGYDHGLHRVGDMQIYTSSGTGGWGPTMRVWARPEIVAIHLN